MKTSFLIALKKSKGKLNGWIPAQSVSWLYENQDSDQSPPGAYVWLGCLDAQKKIVSYMQSGSLFSGRRLIASLDTPYAPLRSGTGTAQGG